MTDDKLMQIALNALKECYDVQAYPANGETIQDDAIKALRARLAQPEPEPVAWMRKDKGHIGFHKVAPSGYVPLYTAPPQREWVGMTNEEVSQMEKDYLWGGKEFNAELGYWAVYRAIEAKLKEKNAPNL